MGLEVAALGVGRGEEIDHHRPLLQRVGQHEGEFFAAQRGLRRETGCGVRIIYEVSPTGSPMIRTAAGFTSRI